jgi:poly(ADP-ribose) glycohydrolase ARH3
MDAASTPRARARSKARGTLLGVACGDALGAPYEGLAHPGSPEPTRVDEGLSALRYTDDTAMTLALAESLVEHGGLVEDHLADAFVRSWREEPWRGYGRGTFQLLRKLEAGGHWRQAAIDQFGGQGSWGNGAAMRVAPIALFAGGDPARAAELARRSARVTHAHPLGVDGASLQAAAVAIALRTPAHHSIVAREFIGALRGFVREPALVLQLDAVGGLAEDASAAEVAARIGSGVDALSSVPAAIAAAIRADGSLPAAIAGAIAMGGDTDTIASMAGAIVGAHLGAEAVPQAWVPCRLGSRSRKGHRGTGTGACATGAGACVSDARGHARSARQAG